MLALVTPHIAVLAIHRNRLRLPAIGGVLRQASPPWRPFLVEPPPSVVRRLLKRSLDSPRCFFCSWWQLREYCPGLLQLAAHFILGWSTATIHLVLICSWSSLDDATHAGTRTILRIMMYPIKSMPFLARWLVTSSWSSSSRRLSQNWCRVEWRGGWNLSTCTCRFLETKLVWIFVIVMSTATQSIPEVVRLSTRPDCPLIGGVLIEPANHWLCQGSTGCFRSATRISCKVLVNGLNVNRKSWNSFNIFRIGNLIL